MLYAIIKNKTKDEDIKTSTILGVLLYLPTQKLWKILRDATLKSTILNNEILNNKEECGKLTDYDFWPHWESKGTENSSYVEPDVFLKFDSFSIIIETKLTDETKPNKDKQCSNELIAYHNEYPEQGNDAYLIALGGDYSNIKKELDKSKDTHFKRHIFTCSWQQLFWSIETELKELNEDKKNNDNETCRLLTDCIKAMKSYGLNSWSNDLTMLYDNNNQGYIITENNTQETIDYLKNLNEK